MYRKDLRLGLCAHRFCVFMFVSQLSVAAVVRLHKAKQKEKKYEEAIEFHNNTWFQIK